MPFFAPDSHTTPRFVLRSWMPGDGPALREATNASYAHLKPWMGWATDQQTDEEAEALCRRFRGNYLLATDFVIGVFSPEGRVLGGTGLHLREGPLSTRSAEIGMWIRSGEEGRGLGCAVLKALSAWAFEDWPFDRLAWLCDARNAASQRVAEKAGFVREGERRGQHDPLTGGRRDVVCFSRLRSDG